jgi:hypothetical protein
MTLLFKTPEDSPRDVAIIDVGYCPPYGGGEGVDIEQAALRMVELQDFEGQPLVGIALERAAKKFANGRGLVVVKDKEPPQQEEEAQEDPEPESEPAVAEEEVS